MKQCTKCNEIKESDEFLVNKRCKDGLQSWCRLCTRAGGTEYRKKNRDKINAKWKESYVANPDQWLNRRLKSNYGLTLEQYKEMSEKQNHLCAVCNQPETAVESRTNKTKLLSVDHCHLTGKIRGLLCDACNRAEGFLRSNVEIIRRLADYVEKHQKDVGEISPTHEEH